MILHNAFMENIGLSFSLLLYRKRGRTVTLKYVKEQRSTYKWRCLILIQGHGKTDKLILSNYKMFPTVYLTERNSSSPEKGSVHCMFIYLDAKHEYKKLQLQLYAFIYAYIFHTHTLTVKEIIFT